LKFLVDAMLGKLSRFLRIFGYDTVYANDLEDLFNEKPISDDKLLRYAQEHERIILTRDFPFHHKAPNSIFLEGRGIYNYLKQLKEKLGLKYNFDIKNARCSACNSEIKKITSEEAKNYVEPKVLTHITEFYQCENPKCQKVFWKGTHIDDISKKLNKIQK
jgi:uncharacterized protein with PIN domain